MELSFESITISLPYAATRKSIHIEIIPSSHGVAVSYRSPVMAPFLLPLVAGVDSSMDRDRLRGDGGHLAELADDGIR